MLVPIAVMALGAAACSSGGSTTAGSTQTTDTDTATAVRGGVLNLLGSGDVDYLDPNVSYYSVGYLGLRPWPCNPL